MNMLRLGEIDKYENSNLGSRGRAQFLASVVAIKCRVRSRQAKVW